MNSSVNSTEAYDDYYDYDIEESATTFFWEELIPAAAVYGLTLVLGILGNSLIIFTISRYRRMKSTTNVFLASLASADLLLITVCIPVKVAKLFSYTWTMGLFLCKTVHYMQSVSAFCSVLTLTAMSIERYYAIVHPMKAKYVCTISQARTIIIVTWIASFLLAVPILFVQIQLRVGVRVEGWWCVRDWESRGLWRFHEAYMLCLVLIVPAGVMAVTYTAICREICTVMHARHSMTANSSVTIESYSLAHKRHSYKTKIRPTDDENNTVKQVIKMLVAVVVVFVVCWAPMLVDNVLTAWGFLPHMRTGALKHMATAFHLMAYFNSCVNPVVYGFMSKNFRDSFEKTVCRWCGGGQGPRRQMSLSHTRTTSLRLDHNARPNHLNMTTFNSPLLQNYNRTLIKPKLHMVKR